MKTIRNKNNPLSGMARFSDENELILKKGIKFGGQMRPKTTPREWFYLVVEACKEEGLPNNKLLDKIIKNWLGSHVTQWRTKNALKSKGYI